MLRVCIWNFKDSWDKHLLLINVLQTTAIIRLGEYQFPKLYIEENADLQYAENNLINERFGSRTDSVN